MDTFPFIKLEGKDYPTVILGEDRFTGWFREDSFASEEDRAKRYKEVLEKSYELGVRGFSMSPHDTLIGVLSTFKKEHPDIVCIANPHWHSHYYLGDKSLWDKDMIERMSASVCAHLPEGQRANCYWYENVNENSQFSDEDIKKISLNEDEYKVDIGKFKEFCDFCLVCNIGRSALLALGREDIVKREIELVREAGFIPIGMCEGAGYALPKMEELDVAGNWVWLNNNFAFPQLDVALGKIKVAKKPLTAFKIFSGSQDFDLEESLKFLLEIDAVKSMVFGLETVEHAEEDFNKLKELLS